MDHDEEEEEQREEKREERGRYESATKIDFISPHNENPVPGF